MTPETPDVPGTPDAPPAPEAPPRPYDDRYRALGDMIVLRFLALIRVGRSYETANQVFHIQLDTFLQVIQPAFEDTDEAVLVGLESDLYLNGVRIPVRRNSFRFHEKLREEFARRRIAGVRITKDVTVGQVARFFEFFLQPDSYYGAGLLEACLAEGLDTIQPAVHATTHAPEPGFADDALAQGGLSELEPTAERIEIGETGGAGPGYAPGDAPRGAAPKNYDSALAGARSLLMTTSLNDGLEVRHAKRVVQPLVDGAFDHEPVVLGLTTLGHHDEFTYMHAVNVGMVAVTLGHFLGLDRRALADLGVASLLHDVGKAAVADKVRRPIESWSDEDRAMAERHPIEGARQIARSTALNPTTLRTMRVALEHHAGHGGYPVLDDWTPSVLSQIVTVADCYVSLLSHRSERGRSVTPYQALGMMLGPLAARFEPALLWALVQTVGLFPPGQVVELSDGAVAVVLAPNSDDVERPHVRVITGPGGEVLAEDQRYDLRPMPDDVSVRRALAAEEYPKVEAPRAA